MRGAVELKLKKGRFLKSSYMKRKEGFKKKAMELSTLCDVPVLALCYGPSGKLDTFPSGKQDLVDIVARFRGLSQIDQDRHKQDLEGYLVTKMTKKGGKLNQQIMSEMAQTADSKLDAVRKRIQSLADESGKEVGGDAMLLSSSKKKGKQIADEESNLPLVPTFPDQNGRFYYMPVWIPGAYAPANQDYGTPLSFSCMPPMVPPVDFMPPPMYFRNTSASHAAAYGSGQETIDGGGGGEVETVNTDLVLSLTGSTQENSGSGIS